ncbi:MAG: HilA/EilA family virulence transcriptional regulator [Acidobacteria bacterium]|nr:HilA/EilA family virulence transcriptional regulator [Acidobacteriota bacterium]
MPALIPVSTEILEFGPFQLFPDGRFLRDGRRVPLSPKEWGVLRALAQAAGALVSKDDLIARVWAGETVSDASLVRAIYGLRRRLGMTDQGDEYIATSYGRGYWLNASVHRASRAVVPLESRPRPAAPELADPVPPRVLEACHEARYHFRKRNVERIGEATRLYRLAADWAPTYAPAHIGLVKCHLVLVAWNMVSRDEGLPPAVAALEAAASLAPDDPEVLTIRAAMLSGLEWKFDEAERLFQAALLAAPQVSDVLFFYARHLLLGGHAARAAEVLEQVVDRDPLSPPALAQLGYTRFCAGQPSEALAATREALALDARSPEPLAYFAIVAMHAGRRQEAWEAGRRAYRQAPHLAPLRATWAYLCACNGRQEEARRLVREAAGTAFLAPAAMAVTAWALADAAETAAWIRRAVEMRCVWLPLACRDPRFTAALGHPDVASAFGGSGLLPSPRPLHA